MSVLEDQIKVLIQNQIGEKFDFDLERIPEQPTGKSFDFLLNPDHPDSALKAVKAIYGYLFWEEYAGKNHSKIDSALQSQDLLTRWIKDRAEKGLTIFEGLSDMSQRANAMFQVAIERSGLQLVPDENEDVYEYFTDFIKNKITRSTSPGERSELAWAVGCLIPQMRNRGLDIAPLIGKPEFYTKFRHWASAVKQRDRMLDAASRRFEDAKRKLVKKVENAQSPADASLFESELLNVMGQETAQKKELLAFYEEAIVDGLQDVFDNDVTVRDVDEKWRIDFGAKVGEIMLGEAYTALIDGQRTLLIAEFDYSLLSTIQVEVGKMIDIKGMTDPLLIIKQLRDFADRIEMTLGGG